MDDPPNNDRIEDGIPSEAEAEAEVDTPEVEAEENDDLVNVDEEDQSDDNNDVPNYDALVREEEKREADEIDDAISTEIDTIRASTDVEVLVGAPREERLMEMKSLFVTHNGQKYHKKTILKNINQGRSLTKSFDRKRRVMDEARKGYTAGGKEVDSVVTRAYKFAHDNSADPNSGSDHYNADDYCCALIKSVHDQSSRNATKHMVIAKYQRFGNPTCSSPLELSWPMSKGDYRASLVIIKAVHYVDSFNQPCLRSTGKIIASLRNIHSSCVYPITPSMETVEVENQPGELVTHSVMQLSALRDVFDILSNKNHHSRPKNELRLEPVEVDGKAAFIVQGSNNNQETELPICNHCTPPMKIGKPGMNDGDINKAIRNHAASHQLHTPSLSTDEPCGLCCNIHCKLEIDITHHTRAALEKGTGTVPPSAIVQHNCETYPDLEPFPFKFCNKTKVGFPCTNRPVFCQDCPGVPHFIWSWNIEQHYRYSHAGMTEEDKEKYKDYVVSEKEKEDIKRLFPINIRDA